MRDEKQIKVILDFWFNECEPKQWFFKDDAFDQKLKDQFAKWVEKALAGQLDSWAETRDGSLALILLLDQMTRNIYRGTPKAFSGDEMALALSLKGAANGYLDELDMYGCQFLLMPMMHSEQIDVQNNSLALFKKYTHEMTYEYAIKHQVIVERFGYFPHRNAILGRPISAEEEAFLQGPDSSF